MVVVDGGGGERLAVVALLPRALPATGAVHGRHACEGLRARRRRSCASTLLQCLAARFGSPKSATARRQRTSGGRRGNASAHTHLSLHMLNGGESRKARHSPRAVRVQVWCTAGRRPRRQRVRSPQRRAVQRRRPVHVRRGRHGPPPRPRWRRRRMAVAGRPGRVRDRDGARQEVVVGRWRRRGRRGRRCVGAAGGAGAAEQSGGVERRTVGGRRRRGQGHAGLADGERGAAARPAARHVQRGEQRLGLRAGVGRRGRAKGTSAHERSEAPTAPAHGRMGRSSEVDTRPPQGRGTRSGWQGLQRRDTLGHKCHAQRRRRPLETHSRRAHGQSALHVPARWPCSCPRCGAPPRGRTGCCAQSRPWWCGGRGTAPPCAPACAAARTRPRARICMHVHGRRTAHASHTRAPCRTAAGPADPLAALAHLVVGVGAKGEGFPNGVGQEVEDLLLHPQHCAAREQSTRGGHAAKSRNPQWCATHHPAASRTRGPLGAVLQQRRHERRVDERDHGRRVRGGFRRSLGGPRCRASVAIEHAGAALLMPWRLMLLLRCLLGGPAIGLPCEGRGLRGLAPCRARGGPARSNPRRRPPAQLRCAVRYPSSRACVAPPCESGVPSRVAGRRSRSAAFSRAPARHAQGAAGLHCAVLRGGVHAVAVARGCQRLRSLRGGLWRLHQVELGATHAPPRRTREGARSSAVLGWHAPACYLWFGRLCGLRLGFEAAL